MVFAKSAEVILFGFASDAKRVSFLASWAGSFLAFMVSSRHFSQLTLGGSTRTEDI
jgi:hypothetical protein